MSDNTPPPADRKRRWIAPLILGAVVLGIVGAAEMIEVGRRPRPAPRAPTPVSTPKPELPKPVPPLTRADLIQEAQAAADRYAAGAPQPPGKDPLVGRKFRVVIPFGCGGPLADPGPLQASYEYDAAHKSLRITARPGVWTTLPLVQQLPHGDAIEDVEGFWIPRPWTGSETCPPARNQPVLATPTPPAPQTLGLARVFEKEGSRVLRRDGRPYELVRKVAEDDADLVNHAYRLVLEGRITGYADGRALECWSESMDHHPICLYGVEFDSVAIEDAVTRETLGQWKE